MMSDQQFQQLINKLDALIQLTAVSAFQGKPKDHSILILSELGFGNTEIARILGTTAAYVGKVKYQAEKVKKNLKDKGGNEAEQNRPQNL